MAIEISTKNLAPVALFVYNRPKNTKRVIEALKQNYLASETDLIIFSDAPGKKGDVHSVDAVRRYIKTIDGFKSVQIVNRVTNYFIEKNIIEGVTEVVNKYGKIIVLEDDGLTSKNFLNYMNEALIFYENESKIMHIAGFTFIKMPDHYKKTIIWRYTENTGGGWATWKNRWDKFKYFSSESDALASLTSNQIKRIELDGSFKCLQTLKLTPIPWDICWYMTVVRNEGLTVNSPQSLVKNVGLYGGTHFSFFNRLFGRHPFEVELSRDEEVIFEKEILENEIALDILKNCFESKFNKRSLQFLKNIKNILLK